VGAPAVGVQQLQGQSQPGTAARAVLRQGPASRSTARCAEDVTAEDETVKVVFAISSVHAASKPGSTWAWM
jgi:hypothetical protein